MDVEKQVRRWFLLHIQGARIKVIDPGSHVVKGDIDILVSHFRKKQVLFGSKLDFRPGRNAGILSSGLQKHLF